MDTDEATAVPDERQQRGFLLGVHRQLACRVEHHDVVTAQASGRDLLGGPDHRNLERIGLLAEFPHDLLGHRQHRVHERRRLRQIQHPGPILCTELARRQPEPDYGNDEQTRPAILGPALA